MKSVLGWDKIRTLALAVALVLGAANAAADSVPPVQVHIKELPSGDYELQWSVPKVISPQEMPSPWLPEQCTPLGESVFLDQPAAWMTRQVYRCPDGLGGQEVGIQFPGYNLTLQTLLRVEFQSGDRYAHMLNPGEDRWRIPEVEDRGFPHFLREAQRVVVDGLRHFFAGWAHLAFLLVLCVLGGVRRGLQLATSFFVAQLATLLVAFPLGIGIEVSLAEIGLAIAALLLAREALRPSEQRNQLTLLAVCAGVVHGLGVPLLVSGLDVDGAPQLVYQVALVLGMDAALLFSVAVLSWLGHRVPGRVGRELLPRVLAYSAAGVAVALAIGTLANPQELEATDSSRRLELPSILTPEVSGLPGSRRLASNNPNAAIQDFISIEAFEVRHEVLIRLKDFAVRLGLDPESELAVEQQDAVKQQITDLVFENVSLELDGELRDPTSMQVDFITMDEKGVLPRSVPVPELVEIAQIGVTAAYLSASTAQDLRLLWQFPAGAAEIPATVTDPENSSSVMLTPQEPVLEWINRLAEDPIPTVSTITVEPGEVTIPLWSLAPLTVALVFLVAAARRRDSGRSFALARLMLVLAILLGPLGNLAIAVPPIFSSTPSASQAKRIFARVLPNTYRALEFREESVVFDRLALSVTGETLTEIYLDHRTALTMEERGGARARVEAVEVLEVDAVEPNGLGGFSADAVWTVGGTVTHFGHRHFRQNRYDARVSLVPEDGVWKIRSVEVFGVDRMR